MSPDAAPVHMKGLRSRSSGVRRNQSERTELQLLRTATRLFSERGFHGTGIRDIADAAGLAVSAMYYYASSKDELLDAIMQQGMKRLIDGSVAMLEDTSGPSERLAALVAFHVNFHALNPKTAQVIDQEFPSLEGAARESVLGLRDAYEESWSTVLAEGVHGGEFLDRGSLGRLALIQMCTGVAHWYRPDGGLAPPELGLRFADMSLALVGARRGGNPVTVDMLSLPAVSSELVVVPSEPAAAE